MLESYFRERNREAGCDEAGRGCLAGPVFAAAVILPQDYKNAALDDSKKLSARMRENLRVQVERDAIAWNVERVDNDEIDQINILNASIRAMHLSIEGLAKLPSFLIIDGNRFHPYKDIKHACIVKGDGKYLSIAAASVLAKTHRDEYMEQLHKDYPQYAWDRNKGYPTADHKRAISLYGITPYHRRSFNLSEQLKIAF